MTTFLQKRHPTVDGQYRGKPENYVKFPFRGLRGNPATA
jgi:hypothetical protein